MRINDYPEIEELSQGDKFVVETINGTKKIDGSKIGKEDPIMTDPAITHRMVFRGKDLGNEFTDEQLEAIRNGSFDDLYVGDYWTINSTVYRIADINYFGRGSYFSDLEYPYSKFDKNHLVILPDEAMGTSYWHTDATCTGGYFGSYLNTVTLNESSTIPQTILTDFKNNIVEFPMFVTNGLSAEGILTAEISKTFKVLPPTVYMMFGYSTFANHTTPQIQLALHKINSKYIPVNDVNVNTNGSGRYWLVDPTLISNTALNVPYKGTISNSYFNNALGVRPVFAIG